MVGHPRHGLARARVGGAGACSACAYNRIREDDFHHVFAGWFMHERGRRVPARVISFASRKSRSTASAADFKELE